MGKGEIQFIVLLGKLEYVRNICARRVRIVMSVQLAVNTLRRLRESERVNCTEQCQCANEWACENGPNKHLVGDLWVTLGLKLGEEMRSPRLAKGKTLRGAISYLGGGMGKQVINLFRALPTANIFIFLCF